MYILWILSNYHISLEFHFSNFTLFLQFITYRSNAFIQAVNDHNCSQESIQVSQFVNFFFQNISKCEILILPGSSCKFKLILSTEWRLKENSMILFFHFICTDKANVYFQLRWWHSFNFNLLRVGFFLKLFKSIRDMVKDFIQMVFLDQNVVEASGIHRLSD